MGENRTSRVVRGVAERRNLKLVTVECPDHRRVLVEGLWRRFLDESRTDLSLQCDGQSVRAHRMIVEIFIPPENGRKRRKASNKKPGEQDNITSMLQFMYSGSVAVRQEHLQHLRQMAAGLGFKMLMDAIDAATRGGGSPQRTECKATQTYETPERRTRHRLADAIDQESSDVEASSSDDDEDTLYIAADGSDEELPAPVKRTPASAITPMRRTEQQRRRRVTSMAFLPFLKCAHCHYQTKSESLLRMHEISKHGPGWQEDNNSIRLWKCPSCPKVYSNRSNLRMHQLSHTNTKNYVCESCGYRAYTPGGLRKHARSHSDSRPFTCDLCGTNYKDPRSFQLHMRRHEFGDDKSHVCHICAKAFNRLENMKTHLRTHTGEKPYKCDVCDKSFGQYQTLKTHKRTHEPADPSDGPKMPRGRPNPVTPFPCDVCGRYQKGLRQLVWHKRRHALAENPPVRKFVCHLCPKTFSKNGNLKIHLRKTHDMEMAEMCVSE